MWKVNICDARFKNEFVESHIPAAILATYKDNSEKTPNFNPAKDEYDLSKYPADKNTSLVIYCNGTKCWKSYKAAALIEQYWGNSMGTHPLFMVGRLLSNCFTSKIDKSGKFSGHLC